MRNFLKYHLPPLLWMVIIFIMSSKTRVSITHTFTVDFLIFKSLHMIEYAILYFLLFRSFYRFEKTKKKAIYISLVVSILYAVSDELHQTFVPTREGHIRDILFDSAGASICMTLIKKYLKTIKQLNIL